MDRKRTYQIDLNEFDGDGSENRIWGTQECSLSAKFGEEDCVLRLKGSYRAAYGMGERFNRVNQRGLAVETEVLEKFCRQGKVSYCPVPFFFTDAGVGMYVDTLTVAEFSFEESVLVRIRRDSGGRLPVIYLFTGPLAGILESFTGITGRPRTVPKWSFGPWMSANRWNTQEEAKRQLALAKEKGFPHTVMVLEAWSDEATFYRFNEHGEWTNPAALVRELADCGIHLVLWQIPVLKRMEEGREHPVLKSDWEYASEHGLCIKNKDGSPYHIPEDHWFSGSLLPDFSNPETVRWWFGKRQYLLSMGVDGFKTDGGEFILTDDAVSFDGLTGLELRNAFAARYVQAYAEFAGKERVLFSRAGYTGQQRAPLQWAGDQMSDWDELSHVLTAGLSIGLSGIPLWGFDIGGFAGALPEKELYVRAVQMGTFTPVMQWHSEPVGGQFAELFPASGGNNDRSPWNISEFYGDEELISQLRFWFRLRMNLVPYLYHQSLLAGESGKPVMCHLALEYPEDPRVIDIEDCFMLGDLLAAPVLERGKDWREVYLPEGMWNGLWDMEILGEENSRAGKVRLRGGQTYRIRCGMDRIPVFVRDGGCIALNLGDELRLGSDVGNRMDEYVNLCFYPAGDQGEYSFRDDLGNEIELFWKDGKVSAKRIAGRESFRVLDIL